MFEDLAEIVRLLQSRGVPHALLGAAAMAGLGVVLSRHVPTGARAALRPPPR